MYSTINSNINTLSFYDHYMYRVTIMLLVSLGPTKSQTFGQALGWGNTGVRKWEVQTVVYKIGYKDILYNTGNRANNL